MPAGPVATMVVAVVDESLVARSLPPVQDARDAAVRLRPPVARGAALGAREGIDAFPVAGTTAADALVRSFGEDPVDALLLPPVEPEYPVEALDVEVGVVRDAPAEGAVHDDVVDPSRGTAG